MARPRSSSAELEPVVKEFPCAGVIIIDGLTRSYSDTADSKPAVDWNQVSCPMVRTKKGHWGFPKGKREKNETPLQNALREVKEETGIEADELCLLEGANVYEYSDRGNPSVMYFTAHYHAPQRRVLRCQDPDELSVVQWMKVKDALRLSDMKQRRKRLLEEALARLKAEPHVYSDSDADDGSCVRDSWATADDDGIIFA